MVIATNKQASRNLRLSRFAAVHLDIEPWIGTGTDMTWMTGLLDAYAAAKAAIHPLPISVDVAGSKFQNATVAQREKVMKLANTVALMQYETTYANVISRTEKFRDSLAVSGSFVVAIRSEDFGTWPATMKDLAEHFVADPNFGGWAIFPGAMKF